MSVAKAAEQTGPHRRPSPCEGKRATIRALFLEPIVSELTRRHVPIDGLLARHGFSRADIQSPYSRVSLCLYVELMEDAAARAGDGFFGLDLGSRFKLQQLGPFYALMSNAENLRAALSMFARFQGAWQTRTSMNVLRDAETTSYTYGIDDAAIWPRRQDAEFTLAAMTTLVRQLGAPRWSPLQVEFEHSVAGREPRLHDFFRAPVRGQARFNRMTISNDDLDRPFCLGGAVPEAARVIEQHLRDLLFDEADNDSTLAEAVTNCVAKRLGHAIVDVDLVARELNLSTRSLRRKLDEEGTSFREILQGQRLLRARKLLDDGRHQISELAAFVGYSDVAVFSRAFKAWTGVSPSDYASHRPLGAARL